MTRFYLSNVASPYDPPMASTADYRGAWDAIQQLTQKLSQVNEGVTASSAVTVNSTTANWDFLHRRFVSDAITSGGLLDGTAQWTLKMRETDLGLNMYYHVHIWVTVGDSNVVRGTLIADSIGTTEFSTSTTPATQLSPLLTVNPVNAQVGDRIVMEVGWRASSLATTYQGVLWRGGTDATDATSGDTITTRSCWLDLSDLTALSVNVPPAVQGSAELVASVSVGATGRTVASGAAQLTSTTTVSASGTRIAAGSANLVASTIINAVGTALVRGSADLVANITLSADGAPKRVQGSAEMLVDVSVSASQLTHVVTGSAQLLVSITIAEKILGIKYVPAKLSDYQPAVRIGTRIIVQEILSKKITEWDLPLSDIEYEYVLCGPELISGKLTPALPDLMAIGIEAGTVWLHVEEDGQIVASGILQPMDQDNQTLTVEAEGFSGYAHGIPYHDEWTLGNPNGVDIDPLDVPRECWNHIQSYSDGNLGVIVDSTTSPIRIGKPKKEVEFETEAGEQVEFESGPYGLNYWEDPMIGPEIDKLAISTPFEYQEVNGWNPTKTDVLHRLKMGYPRIGRRIDLLFEQGINIVSLLPTHEEDYATEIIVAGRGTGRDGIRGRAEARLPRRIRKVKVISEKQFADNKSKANAMASDYLGRYAPIKEIRQIEILANHEETPWGSYGPGDDILVRGEIPHTGEFEWWHRIVKIKPLKPRGTILLDLYRTERFIYGPMGKAAAPQLTTSTSNPMVYNSAGVLVPISAYT